MTAFTDLFSQSSIWLWFILAAVLILLELMLPGLFLIWLSGAALLMGLIMLVLPVTVSWQVQMLIFAAISVITVIIGTKFPSYGRGGAADYEGLNKRGRRLIGNIITVDQIISADRGKAKIGDSLWTISGNDLVKGTEMQVVNLEGNVLIVEPLEKS